MVEEKAYVVEKNRTHAWVEAERRTSCDGCAVNKGCGTGAIAKYLSREPAQVKVFNLIGAEVGDEVIIGIPESALIRGSFMLYIVPLLVMFLGAGLGEILARHLGGGEGLVIGLGLGGIAAGFMGLRYRICRLQAECDFEPRILHRRAKAKENRE